MKPWPKVSVIHNSGKTEYGEEAHRTDKEVTVRFERTPMEVPTAYGLKSLSGVYKDIPTPYATTL